LIDPFNVHGVGLPTSPAVPSLKAWVFSKGSFSTQANSQGYIGFNPYAGVTSDLPTVFYTDGSGAVTSMPGAIAAGVLGATTNSPYLSTSYGANENDSSWRIVSAGLRVRYTGTTLNKGGSLVVVSHPTHNSIVGATDPEMLAYNTSKRLPVNDVWTCLVWCPAIGADFQFRQAVPAGVPTMGVSVEAPSATVVTFAFEAFINFEVNGRTIRGQTPTMQDPVGFAAIQAVSQGGKMIYQGPPKTENILVQGEEYVAKEISSAAGTITSVAKSAESGVNWLFGEGAEALDWMGSEFLAGVEAVSSIL
jgi:hypothetical protein